MRMTIGGQHLAFVSVAGLVVAGIVSRKGSRSVEIFYHGTTNEAADAILEHGFSQTIERRRDPGDFGWGTYLTQMLERAENLGEAVLEVKVDTSSFGHIENPYFLSGLDTVEPRTEHERMYFDSVMGPQGLMKTVRGTLSSRTAAALEISSLFMDHGMGGFTTGLEDRETVVFDPGTIKSVRRIA